MSTTLQPIPTGIPTLDTVLGGGWVPNGIHLLRGRKRHLDALCRFLPGKLPEGRALREGAPGAILVPFTVALLGRTGYRKEEQFLENRETLRLNGNALVLFSATDDYAQPKEILWGRKATAILTVKENHLIVERTPEGHTGRIRVDFPLSTT